MIRPQTSLACFFVVAAVAALSGSASAAASSQLGVQTLRDDGSALVDGNAGTVSKVISVGGQNVRVSVDIRQYEVRIQAIPRKSTGTSVRVESADGQPLTQRIAAKRVTFARVRPPLRVERVELQPIPTLVEDPTGTSYYGTSSPAFIRGALLKATIRLETDDEVRIINLGQLHVRGSDFFPR